MIDLRSDTVTKPSKGMREAMAKAEVGDDVFGEDPTVNRLQETAADLLGKEDALFTPSGVMANQIAIRCLTEPGDEVIVERNAHILNYETAAPALISSVQLFPVDGSRGILEVEQLRAALRPSAYYMPRTSLICLENTHNMAGGSVFPIETMRSIRSFAKEAGIRIHLDGARLWNAWVASGVHPREYSAQADTVSVCFSKGLGAPVGSLVAGSREFIRRARTVRKILGGGMRQAGILAAAALYAMQHHVERLKEDHEHARMFAETLANDAGGAATCEPVETNIIIIHLTGRERSASEVVRKLRDKGVLLIMAGPRTLRAVTHMDVSRDEVLSASRLLARVIA
ncbi:MAG: threonine aldolase [Bacteroidia bacterium]|nr:MAG: threonine aldolase [Bacteroidia bacterium]